MLKSDVYSSSAIRGAAQIRVERIVTVFILDIERTAEIVAAVELDFEAAFDFIVDVEFGAG